MWELVYDSPLQGTIAKKVAFIWDHLTIIYREQGVSNQLFDFKKEHFVKSKGFSVLSCKASVARAFLSVMRELLNKPEFRCDYERDAHRLAAYDHLIGAHSVIYESSAILTDEQHARLQNHIDNFFYKVLP